MNTLETALFIIVIFLGVEMVIRVLFPRPSSWPRPRMRSKLDAKIGYVNLPNQKCFSMDAMATIDSHGYRGEEIDLAAEKRGSRIAALGNSLTFGTGVDDQGTYPAQLEELLKTRFPDERFQVVNAGIIAFTTRQYLPFFDRELPRLKPDIILLGMAWRDLHHHERMGQLQGKVDRETWAAVKRQFEKRDQAKVSKTAMERIKDALRHVRTLYVLAHYARKLKDAIRPPSFMVWQRAFLRGELTDQIRAREQHARKTLESVRDLCKKNDCELAVLLFPDHNQIFRDYPRSLWPSMVENVCDEIGIPYLDLLPTVRKAYAEYGRRLFVPYDLTHYRVEGNRAIAAAVRDFLEVRGILRKRNLEKPIVPR